jgi:hypothetical protein
MDPELKAFLDKYTTAHPDASDEELRNAGQFFLSRRAAPGPVAQAPKGSSGTWGDEPAPPSNAAHVLNTFADLPGVSMLESAAAAGASHVIPSMFGGKPISYGQAQKALGDIEGAIDPATSRKERLLGSLATAPAMGFLPKNPAAAGAIYGGVQQLLAPEPVAMTTTGVAQRLGRATGGAVAGGITGGVLGRLTTGVQTALAANPYAQTLAMQAERAASAKQLYAAAIAEGKANQVTPAIQQFLAEPDIAPIVQNIQAGRTGSQMDVPEVLDRVFKELSASQKGAVKGLAVADPTNPSGLYSRLADVKAAKQQALGAMAGTGPSGQPYMPSYQAAVDDFARRSADIAAHTRGFNMIKAGGSNTLQPIKAAATKSEPGFQDWLSDAARTPDELASAKEGILGATQQTFGLRGKTFAPGRQAINNASDLLRMFPGAGGPTDFATQLQRLGLLAAGSQAPQ